MNKQTNKQTKPLGGNKLKELRELAGLEDATSEFIN
jgi:hypothetical protein